MTDKKHNRLVAFRLGDTYCLSVTSTIDAVAPAPQSYRIIPGTKSYFLGNSKPGRDLISYFHLPAFLGLPLVKGAVNPDQATTLITSDPCSSSVLGLQTDEIIDFIPLEEIADVDQHDVAIPPRLTSFCTGFVKARDRVWALIHLEQIMRDPTFRAVELPSRGQK